MAERCWRCQSLREPGGDCGVCGAAPVGPEPVPAKGNEPGTEPLPPTEIGDDGADLDTAWAALREPSAGGHDLDDASDESLLGAPDVTAAAALHEDRRWRRSSVVAGGVAVAVLVAMIAVVATRSGGGGDRGGSSEAAPGASTTVARPGGPGGPIAPTPDPSARLSLADAVPQVKPVAAALAVHSCTADPRQAEITCVFSAASGPVSATARFRAIRSGAGGAGGAGGQVQLNARLAGASDVSRIATPDGEAASFRFPAGADDQLPYVAWYTPTIYAEVSTTDAAPADLVQFFLDQTRR